MKRRFLLIACLFTGLLIHGQQVINESFDGTFPPSGWTIDAHSGNWSALPSTYAGGEAPEAVLSWTPEFNGISRLISPTLDLSGQEQMILQFNHHVNDYSGGYVIGAAYRIDGGAWTDLWTTTVNGSIAQSTVIIPVDDAGINSANFEFCLYFSGTSYDLNEWYIDNVILTLPAELDAAITSINMPTYFIGSTEVKGVITNLGTTDIESFNLHWQLEGGDINTDIITELEIPMGGIYNFTSTYEVAPEAGVHNLIVWVSDVNAITTGDDVPGNDTMSKILRIPTELVPRMPLFEEFTSSTCAPCASFNNSTFNPFIAQHGEEMILIKYQMNWPGSGDPYYTSEGGSRRDYYGVNAVPMLYVDGKNAPTTSAGVNNAFNASLANPAFVDLTAEYTISGDTVSISGDLVSYTDLINATLHVVIMEKTTTQNVATNGETEFHHVMMRILPDGNGTNIQSLLTGEPLPFEHIVNMSSTNVEQMDDLIVTIFVQDNQTKAIFQATYAELQGVNSPGMSLEKLNIYPNPVNETINVTVPSTFGMVNKVEVINTTGTTLKVIEGQFNAGAIKLSNEYPAGVYIVKISGTNKQIIGKFISTK